MRPLRLLLSALFLFSTVFLTFYSLLQSHPPRSNNGATASREQSGIKALFAFRAPASLFPPSAIISLTDDNTTFFLSRPAMYGPGLPADGLSGRLWVGSGFGDDTLVRDGMVASAQGELGCSDIPGWTERGDQPTIERLDGGKSSSTMSSGQTNGEKDSITAKGSSSNSAQGLIIPEPEDCTDDHLHYPMRGLPLLKGKKTSTDQNPDSQNAPEHADIQALQESAEIAGKVVLLSRGGCGFLEKTKWVQRRGGIALIVGDYRRSGQLINMYAHGDTSNVTIPSIFTAHTSAHLLSSLVPPEGSGDGDGEGKAPDGSESGKKPGKKSDVDRPTFTPAAALPKATSQSRSSNSQVKGTSADDSSWLSSLASSIGLRKRSEKALRNESRRPPSSGRISWIQSDDWDDDPKSAKYNQKKAAGNSDVKADPNTGGQSGTQDNFVIGVHDWRDPDLVGQVDNGDSTATPKSVATTTTSTAAQPTNSKSLSGGSRAPGSGVYGNLDLEKSFKHIEENSFPNGGKSTKTSTKKSKGWFSSLFQSSKPGEDPVKDSKQAQDVYKKKIAPHFVQDQEFKDDESDNPFEHEGLWVTMTPTSMSTSPFFDTLLVLVVSPLVTLTVVYALLLLRSRIRRRRWRAPRSVVDRLPIRTYHTMSYSSSSTSSESSSPHGSSPTSPLLQSGSKSGLSRTRPRSRTMSIIRHDVARQDATASLNRATANLSSSSAEKGNAFKRKYSRKQIECVVCLEEYIDGQSQVMSLPCGHEFHAECM